MDTLSLNFALDPLLIAVLLLNLFLLGTSRLRSTINGSALQGVLLGLAALAAHKAIDAESIMIAVGAIAIKGFLIPSLLKRALHDIAIRREIEPVVGFVPSLLLGAFGSALALVFARALPLLPEDQGSLIIPAALSTVLTGFLVLTTRRKAINQVVGYLILENGIFIMGFILVEAIPMLVEIGVLLDMMVGIFVMGIIINHISREFASIDTAHLSTLKE